MTPTRPAVAVEERERVVDRLQPPERRANGRRPASYLGERPGGVGNGVAARDAVNRALPARVLQLPQLAGNAAVADLLRSHLAVQRQPVKTAEWTDADPKSDPKTGFSWNKEMQLVGTIRRYPIQGLTEGYQAETKGGASGSLTRESAKGRAIVLVPSGFDPKSPASILLHLHGYAEKASRPYAGWRQHKRTGKVRDVEQDRVAQQIEAVGDAQIIGLLPQGGEKSQFSSKKDPYNTFSADAYIDQVLEKLVEGGALTALPHERKVILSAHSGGGHTVRSMLESENRQRKGKPATGLASTPAGLAEVALFEAINNDNELKTVQDWVIGKLDALLALLTDPLRPGPDKERELAVTPRFRAYYAGGGYYVSRHKRLYVAIREWFRTNGKAVGPYADRLWALFQIVPLAGLGATKGEKHEAIVRGQKVKDAGAPVAGSLTEALNTVRQPRATMARPEAYATPGSWAGEVTSSQLGAFGDAEATAFRRAVYDEQRRRAIANPDSDFSPGLVEDDLGEVEGEPIHEVAETDGQALVDRARADLVAARRARDRRALGCRSLGVGNAYRGPGEDFSAWQNTFAKHYGRTESARTALPGGAHGRAAVALLVGVLVPKKAIPGFSNHTKGLAIDFVTRQNGRDLGANSDPAHRQAWRDSWFHHWLVEHAAAFHFHPLSTEEWHWDHKGGLPNAAADAAAGVPASGASPTTGAPAPAPQPGRPAVARAATSTSGSATSASGSRSHRPHARVKTILGGTPPRVAIQRAPTRPGAATQEQVDTGEWWATILPWSAALRSTAGKSRTDPHGGTVADLPRGTKVLVVGSERKWLKVRATLNGTSLDGYVSQELVRRGEARTIELESRMVTIEDAFVLLKQLANERDEAGPGYRVSEADREAVDMATQLLDLTGKYTVDPSTFKVGFKEGKPGEKRKIDTMEDFILFVEAVEAAYPSADPKAIASEIRQMWLSDVNWELMVASEGVTQQRPKHGKKYVDIETEAPIASMFDMKDLAPKKGRKTIATPKGEVVISHVLAGIDSALSGMPKVFPEEHLRAQGRVAYDPMSVVEGGGGPPVTDYGDTKLRWKVLQESSGGEIRDFATWSGDLGQAYGDYLVERYVKGRQNADLVSMLSDKADEAQLRADIHGYVMVRITQSMPAGESTAASGGPTKVSDLLRNFYLVGEKQSGLGAGMKGAFEAVAGKTAAELEPHVVDRVVRFARPWYAKQAAEHVGWRKSEGWSKEAILENHMKKFGAHHDQNEAAAEEKDKLRAMVRSFLDLLGKRRP